jgi:hypothetical protein
MARGNALLVLAVVAAVPGSPAAANAASCPRGKVRIRIVHSSSCAAAGSFVSASPPAALTSGAFVTREVLAGRAFGTSLRALPAGKAGRDPLADAPVLPDLAVLSAHVDPFGRESRAYPGAPQPTAQGRRSAGGISYTENGLTVTNNGSSISVNGSADLGDQRGYRGRLDLHGNVPLDRNGNPLSSAATLEFGVELTKGSVKGGLRFRMGMDDGLRFDAPCPSAAGDVRATEKLNVTVTSSVEHEAGLDYARSHTTVTENGSWHGFVEPDATLKRLEFSSKLVVEYGRGAAWGPLQLSYGSTTTVNVAGSVDGPSGAVTISSFTVDGSARGFGIGSGAFERDFAAGLHDPATLAELRKVISEAVHFKWERFKEAEKEWQVENACAHIVFDPAHLASLPPGVAAQVSGRVLAKDGGASDSRWDAPSFDVGSLRSGLPGATSAATPISFNVVGGAPSGTTTVSLKERATSRGGVASAPWQADAGGWKVVVSGTVSADQQLFATITSSPSATIPVTLQTVGGVTGYHGTAAISYSTPSITPLQSQCTYSFGSVSGTFGVDLTPSADGSQITAKLDPHDVTDGTLDCGTGPQHVGNALVGTVFFQYLATPGTFPTVTVPAGTPSDTPLNWNASFPEHAVGQLNIHIEPVTG